MIALINHLCSFYVVPELSEQNFVPKVAIRAVSFDQPQHMSSRSMVADQGTEQFEEEIFLTHVFSALIQSRDISGLFFSTSRTLSRRWAFEKAALASNKVKHLHAQIIRAHSGQTIEFQPPSWSLKSQSQSVQIAVRVFLDCLKALGVPGILTYWLCDSSACWKLLSPVSSHQ